MVHFDTEDQKAFVLDALSKASVALVHAREAAAILEAVQQATVGGDCPCAQKPKE